jgi:hypothetical protein
VLNRTDVASGTAGGFPIEAPFPADKTCEETRMSGRRSSEETWVVVEVRGSEFTLPAACVREIVAMPQVAALPLRRAQDRGVITLRGSVMPLFDLRKQFGWKSLPQELEDFTELMSRREQDHRDWLSELERSIADQTEFLLARDPRQCAFGKWYYSYRSESPWIAALLRRFEPPHNRIHGLAASADELVKAGKPEEARRLVEQARGGALREMVALFEDLKELARASVRELALVIAAGDRTFAISIDRAIAVENIPGDRIGEVRMDGITNQGASLKVAQRTAANSLAIVLEAHASGVRCQAA